MNTMPKNVSGKVAVIGAGPAGLFAARELVQAGCQVALLNRDIKPGGLAEYGIYPLKLKIKEGLRSQFRQILSMPEITYFGNVTVGIDHDIHLDDFRQAGFDAVLVCIGAQRNRHLGLPGEELQGIYHANDVVYHYNNMPPFSFAKPEIGKKALVIGAGNVMTDISCYLIHELKVDQVTVVARRGPLEVKFEKKQFERISANLDLEDLDDQLRTIESLLSAIGENPEEAHNIFYECLPKAVEKNSDTRFFVRFLASPYRFVGNEQGKLIGVELTKNTLVMNNGIPQAKPTDELLCLPADTVILAIGNQVESELGLPVVKGEYVKNSVPEFPVEDCSYEAFDPEKKKPIEGVFLAGWSRKASEGLVGQARKDGINGAKAVIQYLAAHQSGPCDCMAWLNDRIQQLPHPVVTWKNIQDLEKIEREIAIEKNLVQFTFPTNDQMLASMGLIRETQEQ
ncbi:MAG: FAD-dependent oxidoreductase [Anaerolineaceae bacterium]